jgi:hypothetical protein
MNRRRFLGMVAAVAAAAVGVVKRPKAQGRPNMYGSRRIEVSQTVVFARSDLNPDSIMSRIKTLNRLPDDISTGDIVVWRNGQGELIPGNGRLINSRGMRLPIRTI